MINIQKDRRGVFIGFLIKSVQRLDDDSSGNCCNWLEIGLGTVTDRSPTNSESNFNWSVASPKLVDDLYVRLDDLVAGPMCDQICDLGTTSFILEPKFTYELLK